jgi:hypothetical protein
MCPNYESGESLQDIDIKSLWKLHAQVLRSVRMYILVPLEQELLNPEPLVA